MIIDQKSSLVLLWQHEDSKRQDSSVAFKKAMSRCSEMFALKFKLIKNSVISLFLFLTQFGLISPNLPLRVVVSTQKREGGLALHQYANATLEAENNILGKNNLLGFRWVVVLNYLALNCLHMDISCLLCKHPHPAGTMRGAAAEPAAAEHLLCFQFKAFGLIVHINMERNIQLVSLKSSFYS